MAERLILPVTPAESIVVYNFHLKKDYYVAQVFCDDVLDMA